MYLLFAAGSFAQSQREKTMKLGDATQITIGTKDVEASFAFYKRLGFSKIAGDTLPNPWVQISDGTILILLNQDGQSYMGLTYFARDMDKRIVEFEKMGIHFVQKTNKDGKFFQGIFLSPDSFGVSLINFDHSKMYQPKGKTLRNLSQEDFANPKKYPNAKCGVFGELSHPVKNLEASIAYWKKLGFEALSINKDPYPWAILTDGMNILGLHQTKDFTYPAVTYFAPDMGRRIKKLKEEGIDSIKEFGGEGGGPDNVVLTTPEGQKIFLFSL